MDKTKQKIAFSFLIAIFLAAFEGVVVSTAAPVIVKSLHNFKMISWIFSIFLLTSAISTPIYGKLADLYGRKRIFMIGISIFLFGSLLAGLSQTMHQLIIFRGIQGIGAGAIFTIGFTMIGDIFTLEERSIIQGAISTIWGIAGLVGPLLGGFLIDYLSWQWIFFINIPFGLLSVYILAKFVHEQKPATNPKIDYLGAILLSIAIGSLLYGVMSLDEDFYLGVILLIITLISSILFYIQEARTSEPIVPLFILNKSSIIVNIITFISSFILIACSVYLPLHIQSIMGYSATIAGISLIGTSIAWFMSSISYKYNCYVFFVNFNFQFLVINTINYRHTSLALIYLCIFLWLWFFRHFKYTNFHSPRLCKIQSTWCRCWFKYAHSYTCSNNWCYRSRCCIKCFYSRFYPSS